MRGWGLGEKVLVQVMVLNQDLWFSLPALLLVGFGLVKGESK